MGELYVSRSTATAARKLGDEMIVMSGGDSTLFTLNPTATVIWEAADGQTSLREIVEQKICAEFEVDAATAQEDAETLVRELAKQGILILSDSPIPPEG